MDRKRASGGEPGAVPAGEPRGDGEERPEVERLGPLRVTRLRKDDGRALIVFARESQAP